MHLPIVCASVSVLPAVQFSRCSAACVMHCILNCNKFWSNMTRVCDYSQHPFEAHTHTHMPTAVEEVKGCGGQSTYASIRTNRFRHGAPGRHTPLSGEKYMHFTEEDSIMHSGFGAFFGEWTNRVNGRAMGHPCMHSYTAFFGCQVEAMNFLTIIVNANCFAGIKLYYLLLPLLGGLFLGDMIFASAFHVI